MDTTSRVLTGRRAKHRHRSYGSRRGPPCHRWRRDRDWCGSHLRPGGEVAPASGARPGPPHSQRTAVFLRCRRPDLRDAHVDLNDAQRPSLTHVEDQWSQCTRRPRHQCHVASDRLVPRVLRRHHVVFEDSQRVVVTDSAYVACGVDRRLVGESSCRHAHRGPRLPLREPGAPVRLHGQRATRRPGGRSASAWTAWSAPAPPRPGPCHRRPPGPPRRPPPRTPTRGRHRPEDTSTPGTDTGPSRPPAPAWSGSVRVGRLPPRPPAPSPSSASSGFVRVDQAEPGTRAVDGGGGVAGRRWAVAWPLSASDAAEARSGLDH